MVYLPRLLSCLFLVVASALALAAGTEDDAAQPLPAQSDPGEDYKLTTTLADVMESIVEPSADVLWNAVGVTVTQAGTEETAPETDEDWAHVRWSAVTLAEATNALIIPGRSIDAPDTKPEDPSSELNPAQIKARVDANRPVWVAFAHGLHAAAMQAVRAIDAKDVTALTDAGGAIDAACESCHLQFWYPPQ